MKKSLTIIMLFILLFSGDLFSDGNAVTGELIFHPINLGSQTFSITVTTSEYSWLWDNVLQKTIFQSTYNFQRNGLTETTAFDEPKDVSGANLGTIPWGKMSFSVQSSGGANLSFTIDLRDEDWSQNTGKYWTRDTYVNFDFNVGIVFLSQGASKNVYDSQDPKQIDITSSTTTIWSFWFPNSSPSQSNFKVPVTLFNKIESANIDFGYLNANGHQVNSNSSELFLHDQNQTVSQGTIDTTYNNERKYSFKWSNSPGVTQNSNQNIYGSSLSFTTGIEKLFKSITRNFRTVWPLTIKNSLDEAGGISVDNIYFKDPTTDNLFHTYSAGGSGYVKTETFDSLSILVNNQPDQQYSAKAVSTISYNGRTYQYSGGDFSTTGTDLLITDATTLTANYKGIQLSSQTDAIANNGQSKIVKTADGYLHQVYESLNKVWYERSTDNGTTWQVMNGGRAISTDGYKAKGASVDHITQAATTTLSL